MNKLTFRKVLVAILTFIMLFSATSTASAAEMPVAGGYTQTELYEMYLAYLDEIATTTRAKAEPSKESVEAFVQYAIEEGVIEDTPSERAAVTKAVVRSSFAAVVTGGRTLGYTTAATYLDHSLQDEPADLSYKSTSSYANQILSATECFYIIMDFNAEVAGKGLTYHRMTGDTTLNSTTDLHLSYNKVSYTATGVKSSNGKWTLTIVFNDTYDFKEEEWKNEMTAADAVTALNNYAAYAQSIGAIVPYDITVTVSTTFTESPSIEVKSD